MKYVTFECSPDFKASLERLARQEARSVSKQVLVLLREGMAQKASTSRAAGGGFAKGQRANIVIVGRKSKGT